MNRNITLDIMKGIGIILVALYHSIGKNDISALTNYDNGLFNVIACFFMQMFFAVSGYLAYSKVGNWNWTKKRIIRWVGLALLFMPIYWIAGYLFPNLIHLQGLYGMPLKEYISYSFATGFAGQVTWYLWTLSLCYLMAMGIQKFNSNLILSSLVVLVVINVLLINVAGLHTVKWYGLFFLIGYCIAGYKQKIKPQMLYATLVLFPLCAYLSGWMIPYQDKDWGIIGLTVPLPAILNGHGYLVAIMAGMALLGTGFTYALSSLLSKLRYLNQVLAYLGRKSLVIMVLHILFVGITFNVYLSAILAIGISVLIYETYRLAMNIHGDTFTEWG